MRYELLSPMGFDALCPLLNAYKAEIGEEPLTEAQKNALYAAIADGRIQFYGAKDGEALVGMCSVSFVFSTWQCAPGGIFEDFYILPAYRGKGTARALTGYLFAECEKAGVRSLWVGAADSLKAMYEALGFEVPLGNLLCKPLG